MYGPSGVLNDSGSQNEIWQPIEALNSRSRLIDLQRSRCLLEQLTRNEPPRE
ncbi:MAG: hypothetical protein RLY56_1964, partial [Pseudomonadota bacterium]